MRKKEREEREGEKSTLEIWGRTVADLVVGKDGGSRVRDNVFNYLQDVT